DLAIFASFEAVFEGVKRLQARFFEFGDPALVDLLQRHWIEKVQLFAAPPYGGDQVRRFEHVQVLRHTLARDVQVLAQVVEPAAVVGVQQIQELAPAGIGKRLEQQVGIGTLYHGQQASEYLPE